MSVEMTSQSSIPPKDDPRYIAATIKQLPGLGDPKERRIIDVLRRDLLSTDASRMMFGKLREVVIGNWRDAFAHLAHPNYVHDVTQKGAKVAAEVANCTIVEGSESKLDQLGTGQPVMIVSNHLGTFKLVTMTPEDLKAAGINHEVPSIYYPYLTYFMPFKPVAEKLGDNIYMASYEQPGKLADLFRATGGIDVPPSEFAPERTETLVEFTRQLIAEHPNTALVVFPEGRTMGKISGGQIYDLQDFRTGAYVIASQVGMPILPVGQYFDVNKGGFDTKIFDPINVESGKSKEYYQEAANTTKAAIQAWLDSKKSS